MIFKPEDTPETFWRVSVKALIFNEDKLLVFLGDGDVWETPGGGWDHGETLEQCIKREVFEEAGVAVRQVGDVEFCFPSHTDSGYPKMSIVVRVELESNDFSVGATDDIVEARFVTKQEFLSLPFQAGEAPIKDYVDSIWPNGRNS